MASARGFNHKVHKECTMNTRYDYAVFCALPWLLWEIYVFIKTFLAAIAVKNRCYRCGYFFCVLLWFLWEVYVFYENISRCYRCDNRCDHCGWFFCAIQWFLWEINSKKSAVQLLLTGRLLYKSSYLVLRIYLRWTSFRISYFEFRISNFTSHLPTLHQTIM